MSKRTQALCLLGPLLLVEATAYWKIAAFLSWGTEGVLAFSSGLAFVSLLLGGIVALSQDIPDSMRRNIFLGGLLLFAVQGLANVLVTYQYAMLGLPVDVPMRLFKIDYDTALTSTAVIQGLTLSLVSIAFWQVIATMLSQHMDEVKQRKTMLSQIEDYLKDESVPV